MRSKSRNNRSKSTKKEKSKNGGGGTAVGSSGGKIATRSATNESNDTGLEHSGNQNAKTHHQLQNISITPRQYLLYLHYTTTQISHHLSQSHHVSLLYEYLMDANLLLRQMNLFCVLSERQEKRQTRWAQDGVQQDRTGSDNNTISWWADRTTNGSSGSLQSDTAQSNGTTDTGMKRIQSSQSISEGNGSTSDIVGTNSSGNSKIDAAIQQLELDTLLNADEHNMHFQEFLSEKATYFHLLDQFSTFLQSCDSHTHQCEKETSESAKRPTTIAPSKLELMKWLFSVLRSAHCEKVLQKRPEEFTSLVLGRAWQDIDIADEFLEGLEIYQKVVPQFQQSNHSNFRNSTSNLQSLARDHAPLLNPANADQPNHSVNYKSKDSFCFPSATHANNQTATPMDSFLLTIHGLQKNRSWLIPFNRLTGLAKSTKFMNEIVCEGKPSTVVVSPNESHVYVTMRDAGGDFFIVDRFFGSRSKCCVRPCAASMVTGTSTGVTFSRAINSFCVSPDGKRIVIACQDSSIRVLDAFTGEELLIIDDLDEPISCGKVSVDGSLYVAACGQQLCLFDLKTGEFMDAFKGHSGRILSLDLNKEYIVSGAEDNMIIKWSIRTGKIALKINTQYDYHVSCLCISPHNDHIFSVENFRYYVDIWCANTGSHKQFLMDRGSVQQIVLDPSGSRLFTVIDEKVWIWNVHTAQKVSRIFVNSKIRNIFLSENSQTLYSLSDDCIVRNFELNNNFVTEDLDNRHSSAVVDMSLCQHPLTKHSVLLSIARGEKLVYVWHFEPGILQRKIEIRETSMDFVCLTHFSGLLMVLAKDLPETSANNSAVDDSIESSSGYHLRCFDVLKGDGKLLWSIELPFNKRSNDVLKSVSVSRDDQYVIITYSADIVLVPIQQPIKFFSGFIEHKERLRSVEISRTDNELVTGDSNGNIRKWSLTDNSLSQKFQVSRWRRNRCQCVFMLGDGSNFLLCGSPQHQKWISLHDQSDKYDGFPQSLFSREALTHSKDCASIHNGNAEIQGLSDSAGRGCKHNENCTNGPLCAACVQQQCETEEAPLQDIDGSSASLLQTHERISRDFSGTSSPRIAITSDQRFVVCGDDTGCIRIWDTEKKLFICSYTLEHACTTLKVCSLSSVEEGNGSGKFFVLLCGDAGGRVTCLEASLESKSLEKFSG
mmetsp:Transcript_9389/g.34818  ORF Transcript_9389/g.34818 Transcript_9389/m.34818 type:complete len:1166 (-) Transcript_9389:1399-4896(-)|eukprot:CAMPEP_0117451112 /NCGR_PEP_ID=MMETSP0759-20121206/8830_1 /TAXON_ID=63605 /ORGANISM="Percolomonas cosmopolitus, Strain WS" /LENGTH=1165 /DNA_ID=CAMNT_0005243683 /DNA_START=426 /DNA_END=3923 /DNA_ORIENTATION=+